MGGGEAKEVPKGSLRTEATEEEKEWGKHDGQIVNEG